jgi:hypothetical protein
LAVVAHRLQPEELAAVFINLVEPTAAEMDALCAAEWQALEQGIDDLFLTIVAGADAASAVATASRRALQPSGARDRTTRCGRGLRD